MISNFVNHLQPNGAGLPRANSPVSFSDLFIDFSPRTITRSDHVGPIARPATELGPRRQRRRLEYVKCEFCRRSKKKCEPSERQWPGEKCHRCNAKGFACSAPAKKNRGVSDTSAVEYLLFLATSEANHLHDERAYCSLAETSMRRMCSGLRRNICNLPSPNMEVGTIHRSCINDVLPEELQYACRFWVLHLSRGKVKFLVDVDLQGQVYNFLEGYFLCWVEAISLLRLVDDGINSLESLERLLNNSTSSEKLRGFVQDAKRFVLDHRTEIERFPLHIHYSSPRFPRSDPMKGDHISGLRARSNSHCGEVWGTLTTTLWGHSSKILKIAFSPYGNLLATASIDKVVVLWDLATRKKLGELVFYNRVETIAFSSDGHLLACALNNDSRGWTIKLLDLTTGKETQMQNSVENVVSIYCIALSPDGKLLALLSSEAVTLWDPATGYPLRVLFYSGNFASIAFSPYGKLLTAASADGVFKLWNSHTGTEISTLVTHSNYNFHTAVSSDSQLVALSSYFDGTVTIWDPATGIKQQTLMEHGPAEGPSSIVFSPDGKLLASTSFDQTVKLWDPTTGKKQGMLVRHNTGHNTGHNTSVASMAISPDGSLLAWATGSTYNLPTGGTLNKGEVGVELWELHG